MTGVIDEPWGYDALCAQTDPEAFFPVIGGATRSARQVCAACPVQTQCLEYALDNGEKYGMWAGKSPTQLAKLRRERRA